jgi:5-methyltetrahydrofolate--homocysteine methyltransferase
MDNLVSEIANKIDTGNPQQVASVPGDVKQAVESGIPVKEILEKGLLDGMDRLGQKFKRNEVFIPEVLFAAKAVHEAMEILRPLMRSAGVKPLGKIVLGTVKGDLHDIGKHLVGIVLEGCGLEVVDIGIDVSAEEFVKAAQTHQPDIVGLSALLTTTMPEMPKVIKAFGAAGLNNKIIVGGAPITQEFADQIGADGYSPNASETADLVKKLLQ